jgi:AraC-like DNA-binding protein
MPAHGSGLAVNVHRSDAYSWATVSRAPDLRLKPYVIDYLAYREQAADPMRRLQAPFVGIPMIVTFGPTIEIINGEHPMKRTALRSFLAGLHDVHIFTEYVGEQRGIQINFTLLGGYRFLNIDMSDIVNRCVDLGDLLGGPEVERLADALEDAEDWPARFDILDRFLLERLGTGRPMSPDIAWALKNLEASNGAYSIGALSRELSCSPKTLIKRFRTQIGLSPKSVANILRFASAAEFIKTGSEESWAEVAIDCGYYDQAHFNRDFRRFSGRTPREFQVAVLPNGSGVLG